MKLNVKAFALACGLAWGLFLFLMTWWVIIFEGASTEGTPIAHVFRGYSLTPIGSLAGLIWGLVAGIIGGLIIAWMYNLMATRMVAKTA